MNRDEDFKIKVCAICIAGIALIIVILALVQSLTL